MPETPQFSKAGETSAREAGWALRTFTALYIETGNEKWLSGCDQIVARFKDWQDRLGAWLMLYTDHSAIRVLS